MRVRELRSDVMPGRPDPDPNAADYDIPCPILDCLAGAGDQCRGMKPGIVHFSRRVKRLCIERRPDLLDDPS